MNTLIDETEMFRSTALEGALLDAMNDGSMNPERMMEIWNAYGSSAALTSTDELEKSEDMADFASMFSSFSQEREKQIIDPNGPSREGYDKAWRALAKSLETGGEEKYNFMVDNPFMSTSFNLESVTDSKLDDLTRSSSCDNAFETGLELFKQGKVNEAILAFEANVQKNPDSDEGWRMLGVCNAENDDDKKAIYCFRKALECDPYNLEALLALGSSYVNELDSVKALESLRSWVSHNPLFQGLKVSADEYSDGTLMDEVMQFMLAASAWAPENSDVLLVLGVLYNVSQDYESAIDCFRKASFHRPGDYSILNKVDFIFTFQTHHTST